MVLAFGLVRSGMYLYITHPIVHLQYIYKRIHSLTYSMELNIFFFFQSTTAPRGSGLLYYRGYAITLRHTTVDRTPLDEWSDRRRGQYLKIHNSHKRHSCPRGYSKPRLQQESGRTDKP